MKKVQLKIMFLQVLVMLLIVCGNAFAQEKMDYKIRTDDFYARVDETGFGDFSYADPTWHFRGMVSSSSSSGSWSPYKCVYLTNVGTYGAWNQGQWYTRDTEEVWSGTCLDNADNIYITIEAWEEQNGTPCTYESSKDKFYSYDIDYDNDISGNHARGIWTDFKNAEQSDVDYVDCGTVGINGYYKIEFDVYWTWSTPVNPVFTLSDVKPTSFTITLTDKKDYRITHWDYQVSTNTSFTNIVKSNTEMLVPTEEVGGLDVSTTYYVRFRARNEDGTSDYTVYQEVTTAESATPIELASFTAETGPEGITLIWITESETENQGFILEKRISGDTSWERLADYTHDDALKGQGTTYETYQYSFVDAEVIPGLSYEYRVADVDFSGTVVWHDILREDYPENENNMPESFGLKTLYPNPFNPALTISYLLQEEAMVSISVYDLKGNLLETLVNEVKGSGEHSILWQPVNIGSGMYIIRFVSKDHMDAQKVMYLR